jgi:hypothetical protein
MAEPFCERELLPKSQCAHCRGTPAEDPGRDLDVGRWFEAMHPGRCSLGEEQIRPGDRIRADGEGGYLCRRCGTAYD